MRNSVDSGNNQMSKTGFKHGPIQKLALAPKIKGGAMAMNKRNTDFPAHAGTLGMM